MKKENKDLLIKDLYSRFPYRVICEISNGKTTITEELKSGGLKGVLDGTLSVKPYLRLLSSMTEEEYKNIKYRYSFYGDSILHISEMFTCGEVTDWLNEHHFDYRGLIEKGLALEASKEMYNFE